MTTEKKGTRVLPRQVPTNEDFHMGRLLVMAAACADPDSQRAACIVDTQQREIGYGVDYIVVKSYANKPANWSEEDRLRSVVFAEEAAIDRALRLVGFDSYTTATMYITCRPSLRGVRRAGAVGIGSICYGNDYCVYSDDDDWTQAQALARDLNMTLRAFTGNLSWIRDWLARKEHLL